MLGMLKCSLSKQPMASNVRLALTQQVELGIQSQIYARYRSKACTFEGKQWSVI